MTARAMLISGRADGFFATHPSLDARIDAIRRYGGVTEAKPGSERKVQVRAIDPEAAPARIATRPYRSQRIQGLLRLDAAPGLMPLEPGDGAGQDRRARRFLRRPQTGSLIERLVVSGWLSRITAVVLAPIRIYVVVCVVSAVLFQLTLWMRSLL